MQQARQVKCMLLSLEGKLVMWFMGCAFTGIIIGTFYDPCASLRVRRPTSSRYQQGSQRTAQLRLRQRQ